MTPVARLTGLDAARERFGDKADRFAAFFMQSDLLADQAVAALESLPKPAARTMLDAATHNGIASTPDAPPAMVALFRQLEHVPLWVDRERCSRGGAVVSRAGVFGGLALFGALARSYCSAGGNKPLVFTGALVERTAERLTQTADFVRAISEPHALDAGGAGYRAIVRVRFAHTHVRRACVGSPKWRSEDWGIPINQADMAGTVLLFSYALIKLVRQLGGTISDDEASDLLHLWRYAGYLLGVDDELFAGLERRIGARRIHAEAGRRLGDEEGLAVAQRRLHPYRVDRLFRLDDIVKALGEDRRRLQEAKHGK